MLHAIRIQYSPQSKATVLLPPPPPPHQFNYPIHRHCHRSIRYKHHNPNPSSTTQSRTPLFPPNSLPIQPLSIPRPNTHLTFLLASYHPNHPYPPPPHHFLFPHHHPSSLSRKDQRFSCTEAYGGRSFGGWVEGRYWSEGCGCGCG